MPTSSARLGDQPQVLLGEPERERDGRRVRVDERRPLVAHVRRAGGARPRRRRRRAPGRCRPPRRGPGLGDGALSPKITAFTASFIAAPVPSGPRWTIAFASGSRAGPRPLEVRGLATDHQRELARFGERGRCPTPARPGRPRRARGRRPSARIVSGGTVLRSTEDAARVRPREDAVRAAVDRPDGGVVGDHRHDDVGVAATAAAVSATDARRRARRRAPAPLERPVPEDHS